MIGGINGTGIVADTQIYNPSTNTWTTGVPLPTALFAGTGAVVGNVFYYIGGYASQIGYVNTVWAYSPKTKKWSAKSPMPIARGSSGSAVENNIIYVVGGNSPGQYRLNTVESYNPVTDTWTEEAPLLVGKSEPSVGRVGTTIAAAGGYTAFGVTEDNEGYNPSANSWASLANEPTGRNGSCAGSVGSGFYVAGGSTSGGPAVGNNESFNLRKDKWTTQAPMPQPVFSPGSAVYKGLLYCLGGGDPNLAGFVNYVQIYQP